jgi:hypothetical protein
MSRTTHHHPRWTVLAGAGATVWLTTYGARVVVGAVALGSRR